MVEDPYEVAWSRQIGTGADDYCRAMAVGGSGNAFRRMDGNSAENPYVMPACRVYFTASDWVTPTEHFYLGNSVRNMDRCVGNLTLAGSGVSAARDEIMEV